MKIQNLTVDAGSYLISASALVSISEVAVRCAGLVLGWVIKNAVS